MRALAEGADALGDAPLLAAVRRLAGEQGRLLRGADAVALSVLPAVLLEELRFAQRLLLRVVRRRFGIEGPGGDAEGARWRS